MIRNYGTTGGQYFLARDEGVEKEQLFGHIHGAPVQSETPYDPYYVQIGTPFFYNGMYFHVHALQVNTANTVLSPSGIYTSFEMRISFDPEVDDTQESLDPFTILDGIRDQSLIERISATVEGLGVFDLEYPVDIMYPRGNSLYLATGALPYDPDSPLSFLDEAQNNPESIYWTVAFPEATGGGTKIITAAGLTDTINQRAFNKNGSTVTLKKISETEWLLFGDLAEGDSEGFVTNSQFEFELPPFRPSEEFTQVYTESLVWHDSDFTMGGDLDQPLEYFTQASLDEYYPPPSEADGGFCSSIISRGSSLVVGNIGEDVLLKELPQGAERISFQRKFCVNPSEVVVYENLLDGKDALLYCEYSRYDIYMGWEFIGWLDDSKWDDFYSFLETKMFSVWDSERGVWINSMESGSFYSDDFQLVDRLSQNPSLFTKLRMIDWDWVQV